MKRPPLTSSLSVDDFRTHYWLKAELVDFCRRNGISGTGGKIEIAKRIEQFLQTGKVAASRASISRRPATNPMPDTLTRKSIIGPGWRCTEALREFFVREAGPQFHFNGAMREFVRQGAGKTLGEGIAIWEASRREPKGSSKIAPQFEFNRHMRAYFKANPGKSHADAVNAWKKTKAERGRRRRDDA